MVHVCHRGYFIPFTHLDYSSQHPRNVAGTVELGS